MTLAAGAERTAEESLRRCVICREYHPVEQFTFRGRKCATCQAGRSRVCERCGEDKPLTEYVYRGRCCAVCRATPPPSAAKLQPRACLHCFKVKSPRCFGWGPGATGVYRRRRGVCLVCERKAEREKEQRNREWRATWEEDGRLVRRCSACREVKDLEAEFYNSVAALPGDALTKTRSYFCKPCGIKLAGEYERNASPERAARRRELNAVRARATRAADPERSRQIQTTYRKRRAADPERLAAARETSRMNYRLRRERQGFPVIRAAVRPPEEARLDLGPEIGERRLPARPLYAAVERIAQGVGFAKTCELAGIDADKFRSWVRRAKTTVSFDEADRALVGLSLSWWDVWTAEDDGSLLAQELFEGIPAEDAA